MQHLLRKDLKIKVLEPVAELGRFSHGDENPFLLHLGDEKYWIFVKNLSPSAFKNSPNVTRVQLPHKPIFTEIAKTDILFLILGYDSDADVLVCWNPHNLKERLNAKKNVSLYSRISLQESVQSNEFKTGMLTNGEKILLFKRANLPIFLNKINDFFTDTSVPDSGNKNSVILIDFESAEPEEVIEPVIVAEKLLEITDKKLLSKIKPLLQKNKVLEAAQECGNFYNGKYKNMKLKDWFNLLNNVRSS
jgi:hypothetical protein